MNVAQLIVKTLENLGVDAIFGVPGGQTLALYDALSKANKQIRHLTVLDERTGAYAADAYARASGRLGVCDGTVGPGATNLVSGLAESMSSSTPVLAIVSELQSETIHLGEWGTASQGIDQTALLRPVCKAVFAIREAHETQYLLNRAITTALSGRPGPVALIVPMDVFETEVEPARLGTPDIERIDIARGAAAPDAVKRAAELLAAAERPVMLVGGGAVWSDSQDVVLKVAERAGAPVATTWTGKGIIPDDHSLSLGFLGASAGYPGLDEAVRQADLVLMVATKSAQNGTFRWTLPTREQKVIHIDIDPTELGRVFRTEVGLVGDARIVLGQLADALEATGAKSSNASWIAKCAEISKKAKAELDEQAKLDIKPVAPQRVVAEMAASSSEEDILVCDASFASAWGGMFFPVKKAGRYFIFPRGMAGLGFGLPAAIGAAAGNPKANVYLLAGDGGFAYSAQELVVAARFGLNVKSVVINNGAYGWIRHSYRARFKGELEQAVLPAIDYTTVASGLGCPSIRVEDPSKLASALDIARKTPGPFLIEVMTSAEESPVAMHRKGKRAVDPYAAKPANAY